MIFMRSLPTIRTGARLFLFLSVILCLMAGASVSCFAQIGKPLAFGWNQYGQLGDGSSQNHAMPASVSGLSGVIQVSAKHQHSMALKVDGTVWAWGDNLLGVLGDGTKSDRSLPVQVSGLTKIVQISTGTVHSLALKSDGTVWAWGSNDYGMLGDGTTTGKLTPIQVPGLSNVIQVSAGYYHSAALKSDGTVWIWGSNFSGQIGVGDNTDRLSPVQSQISGITAIDCGSSHVLALSANGTVWAWGYNEQGQLGNGGQLSENKPIQVLIPDVPFTGVHQVLTGVVKVAAGQTHSLAIRNDGTVWTWGNNEFGQLGHTTSYTRFATQIPELYGFTDIFGAYEHSFAIKSDKTVWGWGTNQTGQLGTGEISLKEPYPIQINALRGHTSLAGGNFHSISVQGAILQTQLSVPALNVSYGRITLCASLKDSSRNLVLVVKPLSFVVDGVNIGTATTDASGKAVLVVPNSTAYNVGTHSLTVTYAGDRQFGSASASATLTVSKAATLSQIGNFTSSPGATNTLVAFLTRKIDGYRLGNQSVSFKLDGELIGTSITDVQGKAVIVYKVGPTFSVGAHALSVEFAGDANHSASTGAGTLTIVKGATSTTASTLSARRGETKVLTSTLTRKSDGAGLAGQTLTFKLDGALIGTAVTDLKGQAKISCQFATNLTVGGHTLTVEFSGDVSYLSSVGTGTVTIK
jgi:alpha-tubulin suppressor-like RCC1 family protein